MYNIEGMEAREPKVIRTWFSSGKRKSTSPKAILLAIPTEYTKEYHLDQPTNVVVTPTSEGLLIKKLEIAK